MVVELAQVALHLSAKNRLWGIAFFAAAKLERRHHVARYVINVAPPFALVPPTPLLPSPKDIVVVELINMPYTQQVFIQIIYKEEGRIKYIMSLHV